jgi:hypothetical protein
VKKLERFRGKLIAFFSHLVTETVFDLFDAIALRRVFCLFHFLANSKTPFPPLFAREAKTLLCVVVVIIIGRFKEY